MTEAWQKPLLIVLGVWLSVILLFWSTFSTMVEVWASSRTFAHGLLVLPATLYLVSCFRERLAPLTPAPAGAGWIALAAVAATWLLGAAFHELLLQQIAVLTMLPAVVWALVGTAVVRAFAFPLGFLAFALPVGTSTEPWLQQFTAAFIVAGLHLVGIPLHWEGHLITLSSNSWEVVRDCGGLRYVLPGLALGYLYAGVVYRAAMRRTLFLVLSVALLILANGVRAYSIVLFDHLGVAEGADHRLFSYTIYGLTIVFLFWLGLKWREPQPEPLSAGGHAGKRPSPLVPIVLNAAVAVSLLAMVSCSAMWMNRFPVAAP